MLELIRNEIGGDLVLDDASLRRYAVHGIEPSAVVAPRNSTEAASVLELAARKGLSVECAGAGTRLNSGNAPANVDVVLSSSRMCAIAAYEPADLVVSVEAGVTLEQLAAVVSGHNQMLALDAAVPRKATIGSVVSLADAGPLRFAYGTPRDQVLGLEIVTGDGRVLNFGGRVVKNVAGYDAVRLLVGSRGTLGFITRIHLRLRPRPEVDSTVARVCASLEEAVEEATALRTAHLDPVALELLSPELAATVTGNHAWTLLARLHGNAAAVADQASRMAGFSAADPENWSRLAAVEAAAPVKVRIANLPSTLVATFEQALNAARLADLRNVRAVAHAGDGIVRVLADAASADAAAEIARARAAMTSGSLVVERLPGVRAHAAGSPQAAALMQRIKRSFDPAGVLAPGRFA